MVAIHHLLAVAATAYFLLLLAWGLVLFGLRRSMAGSWLGALGVAIVMLLVLDLAGLGTAATSGGPHDWKHLIYGVAAPAISGGVFLSAPRMRPHHGRLALLAAVLLTCFLLYRGFVTS